MQFPITIGLRRSFFLEILTLTVSIVAAASLLATPWPWPFRLLAPALCLLAVAWFRRRMRDPGGQSLIIEQPGRFFLQSIEGERHLLHCLPGATVHPWLTVLRLRDEAGRSHTLIFTVDNISAADFRRLRTVMRWQGACVDAAGDA